MGIITVYTRQDARILDALRKTGRHAAQRGPVMKNDDSLLQRPAYDWLVAHHPRQEDRPADADYPVWVSFTADATLLPDRGFVKGIHGISGAMLHLKRHYGILYPLYLIPLQRIRL